MSRVRTTRTLLLWAAASLLAGPGWSQNAPTASMIPIELIHDKPYVMVLVNGHGPYRFLIDTGTGTQALISPELVQELAIPAVGHARLTDPSKQGEQRSDVVWVESIKIGNVEFEEVQAVQHRLFREEQNCQGVLGFPLFEDYLLTLDFPGRRMILSSGTLAERAGGSLVPFQVSDGVPIAAVQIDGVNVDAQIDSGGTGLSLPETVAERMRFESAPVEYGIAESLTTRYSLKAARLRPDVRFGSFVFRKAFVEINSAFPVVNIGSTPLKNFVITFDQQEGLMRVDGKEKVMSVEASPVLMELQNAPQRQASDAKLVPVG
ncbi:MAG: aspartyl protease family protein [Acidobacteria bacterium]|nr:aspartyl protease family protein [Acidobacteriota bacterium]